MSDALRRLAERAGILDVYTSQGGVERATPDETRRALLRSLRLPAETDADARELVEALDERDRELGVPPFHMVRQGEGSTFHLPVRLLPHELAGVHWSARIERMRGEPGPPGEWLAEGVAESHHGAALVELPVPDEAAWYRVEARFSASGREREASLLLVVAPPRCWQPPDSRSWGVVSNLYSIRSPGSWGIGDAADLRELVAATAAAGGDFVGVYPLHSTWNRGTEVSPYSPVSRLFRNPLYLRIDEIPELAHSAEAREWLGRESTTARLRELRASDLVEYEGIANLQQPLLRMLHDTFRRLHGGSATDRGRAYHLYREEMGSALDDYALFVALDAHVAAREGAPRWFRNWPDGLGLHHSPAVAAARRELADEVDFHCWIQFELDRQLAGAAAAAASGGMRIGLYQDLATGVSGGGSDAWTFSDVFAPGVSIGAPPDPLAPQGQDWGLPPLDPARLRDSGFDYWRQLLRMSFRHAGALRVDHVLGFVRQFWIPHGFDGSMGAYVRFPAEELFGIAALESVRAKCVIVGEDLGTVPPELPSLMRRWGVLSSKVLYFERNHTGGYRPRDEWPRDALATVNTHDLAPLAAFWTGRDIELRAELGLIEPDRIEQHRAERAHDRARMLDRLEADGALSADERAAIVQEGGGEGEGEGEGDAAALALLVEGVHRFLRSTPAALAGLSLDDLALETETVNVPGVSAEEFPAWTRRMRESLANLIEGPAFGPALGGEPTVARSSRTP